MIAKAFSESGKRTAKALSTEDQHHLDEFEQQLQLIGDRVRSVAFCFQTACYLVGRAGSGKTFRVRDELKALEGKSSVYKNARMSPAGLFALLEEHRESVVVLDDIPSLLQQPQALQILLAALGGEPGQARPVSHDTKNVDGRKSIMFSGGIIAISNLPLRRDPLADAVASRVILLEHEPTDEQLTAFVRFQALQGFHDMSPKECSLVAEFVLGEARGSDYRLDLRFYSKGLQDYRQHMHGLSKLSWQRLIQSSMKKIIKPTAVTPPSRAEQQDRDREISALNVFRRFPTDKQRRDAEWKALTQKAPDALYRHGRKLHAEGLLKN